LGRNTGPCGVLDPKMSETRGEGRRVEGPNRQTPGVAQRVVQRADGSVTLELEDGRRDTVDCLLWAVGREPWTDNIKLAAAGVTTNEKAYIIVDKFQHTIAEDTYAGGYITWPG
uniref:FAD-dependent oxidoreductase n=1 Tax=Salmonella enterica TaxID=28901 RepID=UPI00398C29AB